MRRCPGAVLCNSVRLYRQLHHLSQSDLARACGCSKNTISSIETGSIGTTVFLALRLSFVLSVPLDQLFWLENGVGDVISLPKVGVFDG